MVPFGAYLVPTALDTWAVKGHVGSLDVGPIDPEWSEIGKKQRDFPTWPKVPPRPSFEPTIRASQSGIYRSKRNGIRR
jgi:hypothetical protein